MRKNAEPSTEEWGEIYDKFMCYFYETLVEKLDEIGCVSRSCLRYTQNLHYELLTMEALKDVLEVK